MAKALGYTTAIAKLSREERSNYPSNSFGRDYNSLRSSVVDNFPDVVQFMPPEVTISHSSMSGYFTEEKYGEILAFCEQIYQLLCALEPESA
jgi:hypothetical protein